MATYTLILIHDKKCFSDDYLTFQQEAKSKGLWNFYLDYNTSTGQQYGPDLNFVQSVFIFEEIGWSRYAPEVCTFIWQAPYIPNLGFHVHVTSWYDYMYM